MCVRDIEFTYFYDFSIECWNCSDSDIYIFSYYHRPSIFQNFPVSAILEDTGHWQNMSIVDTGRFWELLVISVLQILEDSGKILEDTGILVFTSIADTGRFW
jgi:hypothetical protein